MREILPNLGDRMSVDRSIAKALSDDGLDYKQIIRAWREQISREYKK